MKIEAHILTYNEEKMIRHTLNHYSEFCNKIVIHDNESTDNTVDIAKTYLNIEVRNFKTNNKYREDKQRELRNSCWKGSDADYVIVCDCDEFLYSENIKDDIIDLCQDEIPIPEVEGYNMFCESFPEMYFIPLVKQIRHGVRATAFDKSIIFDPNAVKDINYTVGSHKCFPMMYPGRKKRRQRYPPLKLLHYKWIDPAYVAEKHSRYAKRMGEQSECGWEYRKGKEFVNQAFETIKSDAKIVI